VGEPPLMLALSAYFALRDAVASTAGAQQVLSMDAPATPERILLAVEQLRASRA
jgi:xanthine dehydrogenase large subunit